MYIMTKIISLSDKAYEDLASLKANNESFSDVVKKMAKEIKKKKLLGLAGAWKDSPEMDRIFKNIIEERRKIKDRGIKI